MTHDHPACTGTNCGITSYQQEHSPECVAEHAAACGQRAWAASGFRPIGGVPGAAAGLNVQCDASQRRMAELQRFRPASSAKGGDGTPLVPLDPHTQNPPR